ncbi:MULTISPECIES: hypothetical protein [Methylotenera]|uniref:hypothetical protein n=1 Tax=Methylotenera TaxID=359407 RepID=UPI0003A2C5FB|nr:MULTISPECIES: hypothetical protein [Methylotenera]
MFKHHLKHAIYLTNTAKLAKILAVGICLSTMNVYADDAHPDIEAQTTSSESVILHANGKWEFVNTQKAAQAKEIAIKLDPAANCPPGSQGTFFGFGRCILPGDKDYQTGSRSGKGFGN